MSWKDAYLESLVLSADPIDLVRVLYRHGIERVHDARDLLARGDVAGRGRAISAVSAILIELEASLNHTAGGSLSQELSRLYQYMQMRLLEANVRQSDELLGEVQSLLATLAEGWNSLPREPETPDVSEAPAAAPPADPFGTGSGSELAAHAWCA